MNKNGKIFLIVGIVILVLVVGFKLLTKDNTLSKMKYDIVIEEYKIHDNSGTDEYSTNYSYIVINSETKEKYIITHIDKPSSYNDTGDIDTISIETIKVSDSEIQEAIGTYGKLDKPGRLKDMLDKYIHEDVIIKQ